MTRSAWDRRIERAEELANTCAPAAEILRFYGAIARLQKIIFEELKSQRRGQRPDVSVLLSHFPPMLSLVKRVGPAPLARVADELADRAQWAGLLGAGYPPKVIISIFL